MSNCISREAAIAEIMGQSPDAHYPSWYAEQIKNLPAADARPVVRGKWGDNGLPRSILYGCSECGFTCGAYSFNYCPNCGATMKETQE